MEPSQLLEIRQQVRQSTLAGLPGQVTDILNCVETGSLHDLVDQLNQTDPD
jgi:hypothetical protein